MFIVCYIDWKYVYLTWFYFFSSSAIDDIVLAYVVGVLEDITSDDEFDVDSFVEMIAAYIPGFEAIEV